MTHALIHAIEETLHLIPFLFLTYLLMEWIEHKAAQKTADLAARAGRLGPLAGGLLGALPQCGFSASASNLYAGGVISAGTLIAIFVSASDEMLPIMISENVAPVRILLILGVKVLCGILIGFGVDFALRMRKTTDRKERISAICEEENCHCHNGILLSSVFHTLQIAFFIVLLTFLVGLAIHFIGEEQIAAFASNAGVFTPIVAALVGLIPNCASSVVLTELFLGGVISTGAVIAGLIANSGVGMLILFRVNKNVRANLSVMLTVFLSGALIGVLFDLVGIVL